MAKLFYYKWKRFWCLPEGHLNLSDAGFLVDPDAEYGQRLNPDVVPWQSLSGYPCLILLGEPGIGKSEAMKAEKELTLQGCRTSDDQVLWFDLRRYQTDQRLHEDIFASQHIEAWRRGGFTLHLFIDSMDECLMRIENIGPVLLNGLKDLPVERMRFRIACRTADWPKGIESELQHLWTKDAVKIYELAPLRRIDVLLAAEEHQIQAPKEFIREVVRRGAVPLAIKPVTLEFLLNTYERHGAFPTTQVELYQEGCRLLCEENREGLRPARPTGQLTADQRLAVATRLAAVTIFCNRGAVWTDVDRGDVPSEDVTIREMVGGSVSKAATKVDIGEEAIWEALSTGLFSSRGIPRIGWSHQTYSEFLAAKFLIENNFSTNRILSLLLHPDGKIVPQLHETTAWVASMAPDVFRRVVPVDPEALLWSDAGTASVKDRKDLVDSLLRFFDEGQLLDLNWDLRKRYVKLNHPYLSEQLSPYILDKRKGVVVRRSAIVMAEACEVAQTLPDLLLVSLDERDVHEVRKMAAWAISQMGDAKSKNALRSLLLSSTADPDDELKGCALKCAWPGALSADELFSALTPPKQPNLFGMYRSFLGQSIAEDLKPTDLSIALKWVDQNEERHDPISPLAKLSDSIQAKALDHLDIAEVGNALGL